MGFGGTERVVLDTSAGCFSFKPISWSKKDTRPTQEEIVYHNAVWKKLCNKK